MGAPPPIIDTEIIIFFAPNCPTAKKWDNFCSRFGPRTAYFNLLMASVASRLRRALAV